MLKSIIKPPLFCYSHTPQVIATTLTVNPAINTSNDSAFVLNEIRGTIYKAAAFTGSVILQLQLASGELFSNVGVDILSFTSNSLSNYSGYPIRIPVDVVIPQNSTINVQLTNNNGETVTVQVQLWGYKVQPITEEVV